MPHLHLSLQSGDDMILKRMKRRHSRADAIRFCEEARRLRPDMVFGADLIAGFPTETEAMFANSLRLVDDCGLTFLHVFPFSSRARHAGRPHAAGRRLPAIKERAARLRDKGQAALGEYLDAQVGREVELLMERDGLGPHARLCRGGARCRRRPWRVADGPRHSVRRRTLAGRACLHPSVPRERQTCEARRPVRGVPARRNASPPGGGWRSLRDCTRADSPPRRPRGCEQPPKKQGWFQRLKAGLTKTSARLSQDIAGIFTKRKLDADTLQELEDLLIQADLGVDTAMRITAALAKGRHNKEISPEEVRAVLAAEVERTLAPVAKPLHDRRQ